MVVLASQKALKTDILCSMQLKSTNQTDQSEASLGQIILSLGKILQKLQHSYTMKQTWKKYNRSCLTWLSKQQNLQEKMSSLPELHPDMKKNVSSS